MITLPKEVAKISLALIIGFCLTISIMSFPSVVLSPEEETSVVLTDTLTLDNQGEIDIYLTEDGKWLVLSLDDLKYITKKNRRAREVINNLESLFERLKLPERESIKPEVK